MDGLTKSQIDKLGHRLKTGNLTESDLTTLDDHRKTFNPAYEKVIDVLQNKIGLRPTGRPAKSTNSIIDKLQRESIRLSQFQDIAGCRVVVEDIIEQDRVVKLIQKFFASATIVDRRVKPSYSYRAVHVIIKEKEKIVEVQVRTELQHAWAEYSEKFSDQIDPAIKYGKGNKRILEHLSGLSDLIKEYEGAEFKNPKDEELKMVKKQLIDLTKPFFDEGGK